LALYIQGRSCIRKEIRLGDKLTIDLQTDQIKKRFSRWSIRHQLVKNGDILSAVPYRGWRMDQYQPEKTGFAAAADNRCF